MMYQVVVREGVTRGDDGVAGRYYLLCTTSGERMSQDASEEDYNRLCVWFSDGSHAIVDAGRVYFDDGPCPETPVQVTWARNVEVAVLHQHEGTWGWYPAVTRAGAAGTVAWRDEGRAADTVTVPLCQLRVWPLEPWLARFTDDLEPVEVSGGGGAELMAAEVGPIDGSVVLALNAYSREYARELRTDGCELRLGYSLRAGYAEHAQSVVRDDVHHAPVIVAAGGGGGSGGGDTLLITFPYAVLRPQLAISYLDAAPFSGYTLTLYVRRAPRMSAPQRHVVPMPLWQPPPSKQ